MALLFRFQKCSLPWIDISHFKKVCLHNVTYHIFACIFKEIFKEYLSLCINKNLYIIIVFMLFLFLG